MRHFLTRTIFALLCLSIAHIAAPVATAQDNGDTAGNAEVIALKRRVQQLEQEIADLQVLMGTLESLVRQNGQLAAGAPVGTSLPGVTAPLPPRGAQTYPPTPPDNGFGAEVVRNSSTEYAARPDPTPNPVPAPGALPPPGPEALGPAPAAPAPRPEALGPAPAAPVPSLSEQRENASQLPLPPLSDGTISGDLAALPPAGPKELYQEAFGQMARHDYAGAQVKFAQFLRTHPNDTLAGKAQFWLGESYYVRGKYREAAENFLKGYKKYKSSDKAPDSLLKLAMSLRELKQKEAACTTFLELNSKFPNAPKHVRDRANSERRKTGC